MSIALTSPITGLAQTGLTSPTYTHVADTPPDVNAKQYAVTALGGTQVGVEVHAVDNPFTITAKRPRVLKTASNGASARNNYELLIRKGVVVDTAGTRKVAITRIIYEIPVGAESHDPESIRAMASAAGGAVSQASSGIGDTLVNGVF